MSRCFPFPPPGHGKKIKANESDVLTKEKHKEKRHKKEKKDRERRESKEKKDQNRDKRDNNRIIEKKREKSRGLQNNINGDFKFIHDLARRINEEAAMESQNEETNAASMGKGTFYTIQEFKIRRDDDDDDDTVAGALFCKEQKISWGISKIKSEKSRVKRNEAEDKDRIKEKKKKKREESKRNGLSRSNGSVNSQEHKDAHRIEASRKAPEHPDLKYLNQILNVPEREEMSEVEEDREWLFGGDSFTVKVKKRRTYSDYAAMDDARQIWNEAFRIESADIVAFPYVVPF